MVHVELDDVSVEFRFRQQKRVPLKHVLLSQVLRRSVNPWVTIPALRNVTLQFHEGERIGVIGHNGAGKSTFLKLLSGIYAPTHGHVVVKGRISNLLDLVLGVEPDADGWSNIAYRSYLQGATPKEVEAKKLEIAEFSGLGEALNYPLRTYSAGNVVRLCFAIATAIEPEILLLDEVLSAGDLAFQEKARARMLELIQKTQLLVFASHDLSTLQALCTRVIWLDHGIVHLDGPADEVIHKYQEETLSKVATHAA